MMNRVVLLLVVVLLLAVFGVNPEGRAQGTIVVDHSGGGHFRTIQEALDSVPYDNTQLVIIVVRNGVYNEKVFIEKSHVALVGEDRDSTRIVFAELRSNWTQARDNRPDGSGEELDWGSAVINIGKGATDVILANMTARNNYGSLYGDHSHQFTIRGFDATRISLLHCNIISDGGDAVALWNRDSGMYYHANCYFEGWVDYVCPRGWCYITSSRFFGHNKSASLWHDGSKEREQKFVIVNSYFDGVPGFPLGRHHRDGQFFFLDCRFSSTMADKPIYFPSESPNAKPWVWGQRHYYHGCSRAEGNFAWFADNLHTADGTPQPEEVTARWTFDGRWDPELTMPSILPFADLPTPKLHAKGVQRSNNTLRWLPGRNAIGHNLYFGTSIEPQFERQTTVPTFDPGPLAARTTYYWRVDTITRDGAVRGKLWSFTTN